MATTTSTPKPPAYMTRSQYAAHIGRKPGYVTQLAGQGRIVFTPDGRFVDVAKTDALLAATADPGKQHVADRHAAARKADQPSTDQEGDDPSPSSGIGYNFQSSKAKKEHYAAQREEAAYLKEAGELVQLSKVIATFADAGTAARATVESWAADLPPMLVGKQEAAIRQTLTEETERLLTDLAARFRKMTEKQ